MRSEKLHLVKYIGDLIQGSDYVYFVTYQGMKDINIKEFRRLLAAQQSECHVLKNTLIAKAGALIGAEKLAKLELTGSTAMICGNGDVGAVAKAIAEYGKKNDKLSAKGGYFEGSVLSAAEVAALAAMPPKPVLQAMLLGVLNAPAQNLASVLNAKAASILNVLNAYKEKIEQQ